MVKLSKGVISLTNNRIQIIREHSGLTLDEFAKSIKIGRTTLYNYESGKNPIPSDVIIRISITYNISADYILGLSPDKYLNLEQFLGDIEKIQAEIANELIIVENIFKKMKNNIK